VIELRDIFYVEMLKIHRSFVYVLLVFASLMNLGLAHFTLDNKPITWNWISYAVMSSLNGSILPPVFAIIIAFIICRESQQKNIQQWFTYPGSRSKFLLGKCLLILCLLVFTVLLSYLLAFVYGIWFSKDSFTISLIKQWLTQGLVMILLQWAVASFQILLSIISQNYMVPISIGVLGSFTAGVFMLTPLSPYHPWSASRLILYQFMGQEVHIPGLEQMQLWVMGIVSLTVLFLVSFSFSFYLYHHREVV
jgi:hypothetical protein